MPNLIHVAIGVLAEDRPQGHPGASPGDLAILIARRPADTVLPGFWELPGGKIEPGETPQQCLAREFHEELGLTIAVGQQLPDSDHLYDHGRVLIQAFLCTRLAGEPANLQVAEHRWVLLPDLAQYQFPPANDQLMAHIVKTLQS